MVSLWDPLLWTGGPPAGVPSRVCACACLGSCAPGACTGTPGKFPRIPGSGRLAHAVDNFPSWAVSVALPWDQLGQKQGPAAGVRCQARVGPHLASGNHQTQGVVPRKSALAFAIRRTQTEMRPFFGFGTQPVEPACSSAKCPKTDPNGRYDLLGAHLGQCEGWNPPGAGKPRQVQPGPRKSNKEEGHREENTGLQNGAPAEHISVLHDEIEDAQGVRG